jgi:hypothetical protein
VTRIRCPAPLLFALLSIWLLGSAVAAAPAHRPHPRGHHPGVHRRIAVAATVETTPLSSPPVVSAPRASIRLDLASTAEPADLGPAPPPAVISVPVAALASSPAIDGPGRERRWGLLGGGLALFLSGYALDIGISYGVGHAGAGTSFVPLIGPLIQLRDSWAMVAPASTGNPDVDAQANSRIATVNHAIQGAAYAVLSVDFALQLAGAAMTVIGAVGHAPRHYAAAGKGLAWSITPAGARLRF